MSIKQEAYNISKIIKKLEIREQVQTLINDLNKISEEGRGTKKDRSHYGYIARRQKTQFLGYLIVNEKREKIEEISPSKVPEISTSEKELFEKAHYIIKYLNEEITKPIIKKAPSLKETLNPYSNFSYTDVNMEITEVIEDASIFDDLIEAVKNCIVYKIIYDTPSSFLNKIPSDKYLGPVVAFINRLNQYGVHDVPEDFMRLNFKKSSPEYILNKILFSLMSFRKILSNINQLIYQAFLVDKLIILNEDNIINILKNNTHMVGQGLTILIQPLGNELFVNLGDLILVKHEFSHLDELCVVEEETISFNQELGNQIEFKLRVLNEDLNPYFGLINNV